MLLLGVGVSNHFLRVWHHSKPKNAIYGKEHSQQVPLLYVLTSIWVLCIQSLVEISLFQVFLYLLKDFDFKVMKRRQKSIVVAYSQTLVTYKCWSSTRGNCFICQFTKFLQFLYLQFVLTSFLVCLTSMFVLTSVWELGKNMLIFYNFYIKILGLMLTKTWKKEILTSFWCEEHSNAGQNIQHSSVNCSLFPSTKLCFQRKKIN